MMKIFFTGFKPAPGGHFQAQIMTGERTFVNVHLRELPVGFKTVEELNQQLSVLDLEHPE